MLKRGTDADASIDLVAAVLYQDGHFHAIVLKESGEFAKSSFLRASVSVCGRVCVCACVIACKSLCEAL